MAKTVLQLQDLVSKLENELELSKFLNKGVLQTNLEYKTRIADLEYENDVLRKAESRLAATEEDLEQAIAKAEALEERLVEEEGRTQAALQREAAALEKAAAAERSRSSNGGAMTFQDKLRKAEWEAGWEDAIRDVEQEKEEWQQKYEQLSNLLAPVITALKEGRTIDLNPRRLKTTPKARLSLSGRVNGTNGHLSNGRAHLANGTGRSSPLAARPVSRPSTSTSASTSSSRPAVQNQLHSSPLRQKRKSGSDDDENVFHPKSTPGRITKANKICGQQSVRRQPQKQYGDDWSDVDADVKSEPDSDCDPLAL